MDPKVERLIKKLELKNLNHISSYNKLSAFMKKLAPSTAEDYTWRIARFVKSQPGFSKAITEKYHTLNVQYKKKYTKK